MSSLINLPSLSHLAIGFACLLASCGDKKQQPSPEQITESRTAPVTETDHQQDRPVPANQDSTNASPASGGLPSSRETAPDNGLPISRDSTPNNGLPNNSDSPTNTSLANTHNSPTSSDASANREAPERGNPSTDVRPTQPSTLIDFVALKAWAIIQTSDGDRAKFEESFLASDIDQFTEDRMLTASTREAIATAAKNKADYDQKKRAFVESNFERSLRELAWNEIFIFEGVRIGIEITSRQEIAEEVKNNLDEALESFSLRAATALLGGQPPDKNISLRLLLHKNGFSDFDWHRKKLELFGRELLMGAFKFEDFDNLARFWINPRDHLQFDYARKKLENKYSFLKRDPIKEPIPLSHIQKLEERFTYADSPENQASAPFRAVEAWERLQWRAVREKHRGLYIDEVKGELARSYPGLVKEMYSMRDLKIRYNRFEDIYNQQIKPQMAPTTKTAAIESVLTLPENKDFAKIYQPPTAKVRTIAFTIRPLSHYKKAKNDQSGIDLFARRQKNFLDIVQGLSSETSKTQLLGDALLAFKFSTRTREQLNKDSKQMLEDYLNKQSNTSLILYRLYQLAITIQDLSSQFSSVAERDIALKETAKNLYSEVMAHTSAEILNAPEILHTGELSEMTLDEIVSDLASKKVSTILASINNNDPLKDFKGKILAIAGSSMQDVVQRKMLALANQMANAFIDQHTHEIEKVVQKDGQPTSVKIVKLNEGLNLSAALESFVKANGNRIEVLSSKTKTISPFEKDKKLAAMAFQQGLYYDTSNVGQVFAENNKRFFRDYGLKPWRSSRTGEDSGLNVVEVTIIEAKAGDSLKSLYDSQIEIQNQLRNQALLSTMTQQIDEISKNVSLNMSLRVNNQVQSIDQGERADFLFQRGRFAQEAPR